MTETREATQAELHSCEKDKRDFMFTYIGNQNDVEFNYLHCVDFIAYAQNTLQTKNTDTIEAPIIDSSETISQQAFELGQILIGLGISDHALYAALLAYVQKDVLCKSKLEKAFDKEFIQVYERILLMDSLSVLGRPSSDLLEDSLQENVRLENLRRMLLTMVDDVRVVLVKLAEQVVLLRNLKSFEEYQQELIANESIEVYAPLANRLGVWQLKWELEDLSFRFISPKEYKYLSGKIAEKRIVREEYLNAFMEALRGKLLDAGIAGDVKGRPKHLYSIWRKMQNKNLPFERVFDLRAVRILVDSISECYAALGVVHTCYPNVPGEFDDYIAVPKENNYQSIHTAVYGPNGQAIEVQIRTHDMHHENEYGIAAHWRYKEGSSTNKSSRSLENKILWLRQLLDWKSGLDSANDLIDQFKHEVKEERVYVFSPMGEVIDLPKGSTAVDFAYDIHTEVGHRCRGAKINGRIVQLTKELVTGDQVEILTVKVGGPSRDWLNHNLGFVKTAKARQRILRWFKEEDRDINISDGRNILEKELSRVGAQDIKFEAIANNLSYKSLDDMYVSLANGELKITQVVQAIKQIKESSAETQTEESDSEVLVNRIIGKPSKTQSNKSSTGVSVSGVGNMLISLAKCCHPVPGDKIVGFITQMKGVSIHRLDCQNILELNNEDANRLIDVEWEVADELAKYDVDVIVRAYDRSGLLHDVSQVLSLDKINVSDIRLSKDVNRNEAHIFLKLQVHDYAALSKVLTKIEQIRNVIQAKRVVH